MIAASLLLPHKIFPFFLIDHVNTHNFFGSTLVVPLKKDG